VTKPSHIAADGTILMVDVGEKTITARIARAEARVRLGAAAAGLRAATLPKGDAFVAAQIAGILGAKATSTLIPLTHPLPLSKVDVRFDWVDDETLRVECVARTSAQTGVEMEALCGATVAALTIYDMCKALDKGIVIDSVRLLEKSGGKSGEWRAES